MRTTVNIDEHLLANAQERARERGQTLGQFLEDAIRREVAAERPQQGPPIPVFTRGTGARPGIDLSSNRALREAMDEGVPIEKLR